MIMIELNPATLEHKIRSTKEQLASHEAYMIQKIKARDWHGVADAAMDIREFEAELKVLEDVYYERFE